MECLVCIDIIANCSLSCKMREGGRVTEGEVGGKGGQLYFRSLYMNGFICCLFLKQELCVKLEHTKIRLIFHPDLCMTGFQFADCSWIRSKHLLSVWHWNVPTYYWFFILTFVDFPIIYNWPLFDCLLLKQERVSALFVKLERSKKLLV